MRNSSVGLVPYYLVQICTKKYVLTAFPYLGTQLFKGSVCELRLSYSQLPENLKPPETSNSIALYISPGFVMGPR